MKIGISGPIFVTPFRKYLYTTTPADVVGVKGMGGTAVNTLALGLLDRGCHLTLISLDTEAKEEIVLSGPQLRICIGPYRLRARIRAMDFFSQERGFLHHVIQREKPDIVHAHWTYEYALGALASGIPTLITVRDWAPAILWYNKHNYRAFAYRVARFIMDRMTFKRARHLSANSRYIQQRIQKRWKTDVPIIPNPIADSFLRREEPSYPSSNLRIIAVMNGMDAWKNPIPLIRAFSIIRKEIPECVLMLIGIDYQERGKAHRWARENRLEQGCEFIGPLNREQLVHALDNASLMIHPSLEESFGNVLIEAMARRIPVLGGKNSGAVPWVLDDGRAGALCDVRKPEDIAGEALRILTSRECWRQLSQAGYENVQRSFGLTRVVDLCLEQYRLVLNAESQARTQ